jgi:hypothetical protein
MENKLEIIETTEYTLAVSNEALKENDYALDLTEDMGLKYDVFIVDKATLKFANQECKKIIAHKPKRDAKELEGVLLILKEEDEVEKLANDLWDELGVFTEGDKHLWLGGFRNGYKAGGKKYSKNDLRRAFNYGTNEGYNYRCLEEMDEDPDELSEEDWNSFIKNLKQHKYFIAEIGKTHCDRCPNGFEEYLLTKVIDGKTYLKGKFTNK